MAPGPRRDLPALRDEKEFTQMPQHRTRALAALAAAGALVAAPALAQASPVSAAAKVARHTDRADDALARAASLFQAGKEPQAVRALHRSRAEIGKADAAAAKLIRRAGTGAERAAAARALRVVAIQRDENVNELAEMLGDADSPAADKAVADAVMSDVTGRDKAISVLRGLIAKGMPAKAEVAITKVIAKLSADRRDEADEVAEAVAEGDVSPAAAATLTRAIDKSLRGRDRAAATITALLETAPEAAKAGLQRALDAISKERPATGRPAEGPGADDGQTGVPVGVTAPEAPEAGDAGRPATVPAGPPEGVGGSHTPPAGPRA
jgi:hypothetical protein